jgi:hypothetical protein
MVNENNQPSEEEIRVQREEARASAMQNLGGGAILDLASAYFTESSGGYGEVGSSAVDQFIYAPAARTPRGAEIINGILGNSRQGGRRYTGNVTEYQIIESAAQILQQSLASVYVPDVLNLMGSGATVDPTYNGVTVDDLLHSEDEEVKKLGKSLLGGYQTYITDTKVAEALGKKANAVRGSLEELVRTPENQGE